MEQTVPAEALRVGDVVTLRDGSTHVTLTHIAHRVHGIKLVGRDQLGRTWSFGMRYGEDATTGPLD